jgi:hypothetical protein
MPQPLLLLAGSSRAEWAAEETDLLLQKSAVPFIEAVARQRIKLGQRTPDH